jgi:hypothetical protein
VTVPFVLGLVVGSWLLASLLFSGGGPLAAGADPLLVATHVLLDQGPVAGLAAFWGALGPGAGWLFAEAMLFHLVVTVVRHVRARRAYVARAPQLGADERAAAEDAYQFSALLMAPALLQAGGLVVASLLTVIPFSLALFALDDRSPWPCWLVVLAVRLGVEVWCVAMDRSEPATAS